MNWHLVHIHLGQLDVAEPAIRKALQLDPLHHMNHFANGFLELVQGHFDEAIRSTDGMVRLDPDNIVTLWCSAVVRIWGSRPGEAVPFLERLEGEQYPQIWRGLARFTQACLTGRRQDALVELTPDVVRFARNDEYPGWNVSGLLALIGEHDQALDWLDHVTGTRQFINYPFFSSIDTLLAPLRGNSRFESIMARVEENWRSCQREIEASG